MNSLYGSDTLSHTLHFSTELRHNISGPEVECL